MLGMLELRRDPDLAQEPLEGDVARDVGPQHFSATFASRALQSCASITMPIAPRASSRSRAKSVAECVGEPVQELRHRSIMRGLGVRATSSFPQRSGPV
jgi:hypothetical protein